MVTPEQEAASVMRCILDAVGNLRPYYHNIPEEFAVPSVFFPMPEVTAEPDTFLSYSADYQWYVKFFAGTTGEAYGAGMTALTAIQAGKRLVPLLNEAGERTGERLRLNDLSLKAVDDETTGFGTAQLYVSWKSRRPYNDKTSLLMRNFHLYLHDKGEEEKPEPAETAGSAMAGYYLQEQG